jgi:hypothetical protein
MKITSDTTADRLAQAFGVGKDIKRRDYEIALWWARKHGITNTDDPRWEDAFIEGALEYLESLEASGRVQHRGAAGTIAALDKGFATVAWDDGTQSRIELMMLDHGPAKPMIDRGLEQARPWWRRLIGT